MTDRTVPGEIVEQSAPLDAGHSGSPRLSVTEVQEAVREKARARAGFTDDKDKRSVREVLAEHKLTLYPLIAIVCLGAAQAVTASAEGVLQPEITRSFGVGVMFTMLTGLGAQVVGVAVPLLVSKVLQDRPWRAIVTVVSALIYAVGVVLSGFAPSLFFLALLKLIDTGTSAANDTVSGSLTMDLYPPAIRVRVFTVQASAGMVMGVVMSLMLYVLTGPLHLTWRGVYVVAGVMALGLALVALKLRDPGYGRFDRDAVGELIREEMGHLGEPVEPTVKAAGQHPTFLEVYRSLWAVKTMRLSLIGVVVSGLTAPLGVAINFYLADSLNFTSADLALQNVFATIASLVGLYALAPIGDRIFRRSPRTLMWIAAGLSMAGSLVLLLQLVVHDKPMNMAITALTAMMMSVIGPASAVAGMSVIPPEHRHYSGSAFTITALLGTSAGTAIFAVTLAQGGMAQAIIGVVISAVAGSIFTGFAGDAFVESLDAGTDRLVEDIVTRSRRANGGAPPLLDCSGIDFSYGQVKVLHSVDLQVEEGEMFALLGLNGSGKSTLLRTIAGLGMPTRGSIRIGGYDITRASVERRTANGVVLMPGGRATFRSLTVMENLQTATAHMTAEERRRSIAQTLDRFPALVELGGRKAALLSGGEAQMLGLARAFLLKPRLLMIDELSLGLAPRVVGELVGHVRELNEEGVTVIVVEQSLNIAGQLAERAAFMDRGQVRFCGPMDELAKRDDLLRAVFLKEGS